jgi:hypothetical protein
MWTPICEGYMLNVDTVVSRFSEPVHNGFKTDTLNHPYISYFYMGRAS